jgi:diguanylate cyclase (GGDEF)-like protein
VAQFKLVPKEPAPLQLEVSFFDSVATILEKQISIIAPMKSTNQTRLSITQPGTYSLLLACAWTFVVFVSLLVSITVHRQEVLTTSLNVARAYIDKDILYRNWNSLHGGVYVETDKGLLPNPFFPPSVKDRDVITPSGRHLTLVNPAYMTRLINELAQNEHQMSSRVSSLKPLRPENIADVWETSALQSFEKGALEISSLVTEEDSIRYLRLMRPLVTEESCLPCHVHQGYKTGDIRGGISIKLPMTLFESSLRKEIGIFLVAHGVIWLLGLTGLYIGYTRLRLHTKERNIAEAELVRLNVILEDQATTDSLTGLCNRRKFFEKLQEKILEAKRYKMPLTLIFIDIDHFKAINDTYGHDVGDSTLQELVNVVINMIRQTDIFARLGGEEFVILTYNNDIRSGRDLAEKIRSCVEQHRFPQIGAVTCSFGVAQQNVDDTAETVIKRADAAMYAAKREGRNRVVIDPETNDGVALESEII